jgi:predicted DCC family thiol-disulfide oxidoreductase YuxK
VSGPALPPRLVLYDGVCGLCDHTVQWLLDHDPAGRLSFAPLQGETAAAVRARHPELPHDLDSVILVEQGGAGERLWWRSAAVFRLAGHIGGVWGLLRHLGLLPAALTDLGYRFVAAVRYRVFGVREACRLPRPEERARFLP